MRRLSIPPVLLAATLAAALPQPAVAATKTVDAGLPMASHARFWAVGSSDNAFFPDRVTIRVGDSLRFRPSGFHSVHLLGRRGSLVPGWTVSVHPVTGAIDALGVPFWFNGMPQIGNASAQPPHNFGRRFAYSGRASVLSGYPSGQRKSMVVRFTKPGTFTFYCDYHRGMKGTVRVLPKGRNAPSPKRDARRVRRQLATALGVARTLQQTVPPAGVFDVGVAGAHGTEFYDFRPKVLTVPAGTVLTFRASPGSMEYHTVAAGPGDPQLEPASLLGTMAASFERRFTDPRAAYPSEPAGTTADLTPLLHGDGFWSSGILDNDPKTTFSTAAAVRFPIPGTYVFSCLIHKYMHATVYVT